LVTHEAATLLAFPAMARQEAEAPVAPLPPVQPDPSLVLLCPLRIIRWEGAATGPVVGLLWHYCGVGQVEVAISSAMQLVGMLGEYSRRPVDFGPVNAPELSADERSLMTLIGCVRRGEAARAEALANWLMPAGHDHALLNAAETLASCI